ncbi:YfbR-like 5'-deoxynucleotidase [Vibrio crassostreae]|uniref:YfbR-like 5'-deoxynucleotidase n=1 Tax=Vibrio crassostreae TaxID=246167 RepID=UPI001B314FB2|nr:YfbR-like 5'-deoxynucleotidase [Vibrio crassostreae]
MENQNIFLALLSRMDRVSRWSKSHCFQAENLNDHSAHAALICLFIGLKRQQIGTQPAIDPYRLAMYGLTHDCGEILAEDVNGIFKKKVPSMHTKFKEIELATNEAIARTLPAEFYDELNVLMRQDLLDPTVKELVKAADILQSLSKAIREHSIGNMDFRDARNQLNDQIQPYCEKYPEVKYVYDTCLDKFGHTIDQLVAELPVVEDV